MPTSSIALHVFLFLLPEPRTASLSANLFDIIQFHDWSDDRCREILLALKPAMIPGYTKVLLQERVVPSQGASWLSTAADLVMMCGLAGKERTERGFRELVDSVGMKITGIYTRTPGEESIIEVVIPK